MTDSFILCADDYGLAAGVTRGILELADARRLSATSAIVTLPRWRDDAEKLQQVRPKIACGLHINLTLGKPLGPAPRLAPGGDFTGPLKLAARAAALGLAGEIADEVERQLDAFETAFKHAPDYVDGHHHVHAMPVVRDGVLAALSKRQLQSRILLRNPGDAASRIAARGRSRAKAAAVAALAAGFGKAAEQAGFTVNDGFSGFAVDDDDVAADFRASAESLGPRHLMMCHPGFVDGELALLDKLTDRRHAELKFLLEDDSFASRVWLPSRNAAGAVNWPAQLRSETTP